VLSDAEVHGSNVRTMVELSATLSNRGPLVERLSSLGKSKTGRRRTPRPTPRKPLVRLNLEEVQDLAAAYEAGESMKELAERFGISRWTVADHLKRTGTSTRHRVMNEARIAKCVELYAAGLSLVSVGEELRVGGATVRRALLGAGIAPRPRLGFSSASKTSP